MKNKILLVQIVIVLALITQSNHAEWVFYKISKTNDFNSVPFNIVMAWIFAISLEMSIFIFTLFGKRNTAIFFAIVSTLINLLYYWYDWGATFSFIAMLVISPIIPLTIKYYSSLIQELNELPEPEQDIVLPTIDVDIPKVESRAGARGRRPKVKKDEIV